jgi:quercetin dioxygenase-like cupin family protein
MTSKGAIGDGLEGKNTKYSQKHNSNMNHTIELIATGESIEVIKSASDTAGAYLEAIVRLKANGDGPPMHRHPYQSEEFTVLEGTLMVEMDGVKHVLEVGETIRVEPNSVHRFSGHEGKAVAIKSIVTPALNLEYFITEIFEASNRNKAKAPTAMEAAFIIHQMRGEYYLAEVPVFIQRFIFPVLASVGRLLGKVKARKRNAE